MKEPLRNTLTGRLRKLGESEHNEMAAAQDHLDRPRAKTAGERQRHPTEVRRQLVVDAARDLIADKGLFNVLIRDISKACGVSPGTISYHFKGLDEVLMEVVKAETADFYVPLQQSAKGSGDPGKELLYFLEGMFGSDANSRRHWLIWLDFWSAAARDEQYGEWMNAHYTAWRDALQDVTERGVSEGSFHCADPRGFAIETAAMVDGLAVQCYSRGSVIPVDMARELLVKFVKRELRIS
ncbi:AcrR family transcriptional regulator [Arthrobacter sp. V4I6]|uniref:TetR/AcrR family transcriptional regulator n=1 Tax=unclassified Arthrobacter TaxID=235627 RepID=UPI002786C27E|nr:MULTISPECIES: TetR/AcrR family transcriptional regulator [unclassified Arthrobacter]MDQ0822397.1 AcrR family transcriptional regulator [Arthrobacter sp. V1I7]MDQ0852023.1 AcrR family transcriptional regulator [Arthrobacter sp. V4I6]